MHPEVFKRYTSSISTNPVTSNIGLSRPGSNWAWAMFGIFTLSMLTLGVVAHSRPMRHRAFHYIGLAILAATALHWATQASNLGYTSVPVEFVRSGSRGANQLRGGAPFPPTRSIFYARYIGWAVTWPLLVLLVLLATGFNLSRIFVVLFFALFSIIAALVGTLVRSRYRWMYYVFAVSSLFYVVWHLLHPAPRSARRLGADRGRVIRSAATSLGLLFLIYPIVWGLCEYGNVLTVSSEMFWYGVLDFLTRVVWLFAFLFAIEGLAYERFGFHSGKGTDGADYRGNATSTSVAGNQGAPMRSTNGGGGPASTGAGNTGAETATGEGEPAGAGRRELNDNIGSGPAAPNARGDNFRETV
ncbi:hypothetical protein Rt10032_c14g5237 [Rhodotorula toruloides]|uniref:Family A G protein-coupled receptor-like protein n=1 Tax=Rhodotorula toruloides TaxID=5286 RepID=A0A511KLH6_RHOTO|nr:hypothetical protein Rt10032_c14g5237 [Rhodotorula toruloides]